MKRMSNTMETSARPSLVGLPEKPSQLSIVNKIILEYAHTKGERDEREEVYHH